MLLSASEEDVLAAAEALGEELAAMESDASPAEFQTVLLQCNEAINEETGVQYGDACGAGGSC
ncbi:halo-CC-star protein HcsS [Haloarcula laminariae]|uniref:halo-CC-star protein HcsS n=1 Tax=Haloarcula laminariae TaxID=2961577 RepID=UPI0024074C82|nr:halo-CC-star protein HcsS [Halomicroarcula sp. FL173]